jgi:hypothetical protein
MIGAGDAHFLEKAKARRHGEVRKIGPSREVYPDYVAAKQ